MTDRLRLTGQQDACLRVLREIAGPAGAAVSNHQIARAMRRSHAHAAQLVHQLKAKGAIEVRRAPDGRRRFIRVRAGADACEVAGLGGPRRKGFDAEGRSLGAPSGRPAGDRPAWRKCLSCDARFWSEGWGNRMCGGCKKVMSDGLL